MTLKDRLMKDYVLKKRRKVKPTPYILAINKQQDWKQRHKKKTTTRKNNKDALCNITS